MMDFCVGAAGEKSEILVDIFLWVPSVSLAPSRVLREVSMLGLRKQSPLEGHTGATFGFVMTGIGIFMVSTIGSVSVACLKMSSKWKRAWW